MRDLTELMAQNKEIRLLLEDGTVFHGRPFGSGRPAAGEVVFNTGMVGYPESLTDPSYKGQILVFTYPLIGNYGIPADGDPGGLDGPFESGAVQVEGVAVSEYSVHHSHHSAASSLDAWLKEHDVPGIWGVDTRHLAALLRERGSMPGQIAGEGAEPGFRDPNLDNLVATVSPGKPEVYERGRRRVVVVDCGCKNSIIRSLLARDVTVIRVPWDHDFMNETFDGVLVSNGPGDPVQVKRTVEHVRNALEIDKPVLGICLGNQILALAAGGSTYKLKFGHRSQNQPCVEVGTKRCTITSQNHGYAVDTRTLPSGWEPWFINANDGTNEGIRHRSRPFMSVQFHPEASPGPTDADFVFDAFLERLP